MKYLILTLLVVLGFAACSTQEINKNVDSIGNGAKEIFNAGSDAVNSSGN
jgi:hypothetical protein